MSEWFVLLN